MRKIRDALRLRTNGLSMREIAASLGVGQSTLSDYLKRAARAGLVWPLPEALTDAALEAMLFQPMGGATRRVHAQPDWPTIHRELRRKDVTLALLWEEYRAVQPAVNRTYADMAAHYDTAVVPARPHKPRDKAKVEVAVQVAQR